MLPSSSPDWRFIQRSLINGDLVVSFVQGINPMIGSFVSKKKKKKDQWSIWSLDLNIFVEFLTGLSFPIIPTQKNLRNRVILYRNQQHSNSCTCVTLALVKSCLVTRYNLLIFRISRGAMMMRSWIHLYRQMGESEQNQMVRNPCVAGYVR